MNRGFAGECPGFYAGVDEVRAPGGRVARHDETDGHCGICLRYMRTLWWLGQVVGFMLGTEVREYGQGCNLMVLGTEGTDEYVYG